MSKIAVVTDSTAYIPADMLVGLNVYSLPLQVIWDEHIFLDGVDIQPAEFYNRLSTSKTMPSTSQVTPVAFRDLYSRLIEEGYDIFSIHISSKLSGTLDSAVQACSHIPQEKVLLFDSESTSMALGFQVLAVARAASQGATLRDLEEIARKARDRSDVYFAVSTLEFLRRGGRIGGGAAFIGTALNLKPILKLKEGKVEAVEKIRTMSKAIDRLTDLVQQRIGDQRPIHLAAVHTNAQPEAAALLERLRQKFSPADVVETTVTAVSPVIGVHGGPGLVGMAYMAGM